MRDHDNTPYSIERSHSSSINGRRRVLRAAALGAVGIPFSNWITEALAKGDLPAVPGINQLEGKVLVNGNAAKVGTLVKPGDRVVTEAKSKAVIVLDKDAFLIREGTELEFTGAAKPQSKIKVNRGKLLSVWESGPEKTITLPFATITLRGTGTYIEVLDASRAYMCLCYGTADISGAGLAAARQVISKHHENPLWLSSNGTTFVIDKASVRDHTDAELEMLEGLCGRETPFKDIPAHLRY